MAAGRGKLILVTGGARSGKSALAQRLAAALGGRVTYLATAVPTDPEMEERIARHRAGRPDQWETVEEPLAVPAVLRRLEGKTDVVLLDCLTVWLANLLLGPGGDGRLPQGRVGEEVILAEVQELAEAARAGSFSTVVVTNEVGCGVVPAYPLGRLYRDVAGLANQILARAADEVWLTVAGLPLRLK